MAERLLKKAEIAERFGTCWKLASRLLREHGVTPVDLGRGRGKGQRWLESSVDAVILAMHRDAQPKPKTKASQRPPGLPLQLHKMKVDDLMAYIAKGETLQ